MQQISDVLEQIDELENPTPPPAAAAPATTRTTRSNKSGKAAASTSGKRPAASRAKTKNATEIRRLNNEIKDHSSAFYTLIPHDFGRSLPPAIDTMDHLKQKISLLEVLSDVEISQNLEKEQAKAEKEGGNIPINPIDAQYYMLKVDMEPLPETEEDFQIIKR